MVEFDPTNYPVNEGAVAILRIVKIGEADYPVSVNLTIFIIANGGIRVRLLSRARCSTQMTLPSFVFQVLSIIGVLDPSAGEDTLSISMVTRFDHKERL